jgi:hypothetical protein
MVLVRMELISIMVDVYSVVDRLGCDMNALVDENKPIDANALVDIVIATKTGRGLRTIIFIFNIVHLVGAHRCRRLAGQLAIG